MHEPLARPPPDSDEALMLSFAAGDLRAFDVLYARHRRGLYAFIARLVPAREAWVDDLFQEVWLAVARSRASYRPTAKFRTWLYQIARNRSIDVLRVREPLLASELATGDDGADPFDAMEDPKALTPERLLEGADRAQALTRALEALPAAQREAFLLREHGEMPLEEIARVTGVNVETAKSRLRYAVRKLRAALCGIWP